MAAQAVADINMSQALREQLVNRIEATIIEAMARGRRMARLSMRTRALRRRKGG